MKALAVALVVLLGALPCLAKDWDAGIANASPHLKIPGGPYRSIKDIDFANGAIQPVYCEKPTPKCWPALKDGHFERDLKFPGTGEHMQYDVLDLKSVDYLADGAGSERFALVRFSSLTVGGSSSPSGGVIIVELDETGTPVIRQQIDYNVRNAAPDEAWAWLSPNKKRLVISATHGWEHCCPRERLIITFDWDSERFVPIGRRIRPLRRP